MSTVVILDSSKEVEEYQRIITSFQKQIDCKIFQSPEKAIEYVRNHPVAVMLCEMDMPIMSGIEVFEVIELISPLTIRIAMAQGTDVSKIAEIFNQCGIFRLILKPFFLAEELEEPIWEALEKYSILEEKDKQKRKMENELERRVLNIQQLSIKLEKKRRTYDGIYQVAIGFIHGNINSEAMELDEEEKSFFFRVCEELLNEFMRYYIFEIHSYKFHLKYLQELFHHPQKGRLFQIQCKIKEEIPEELLQKIAYGIFLGGYLCQQLLIYYRAIMIIEKENSVYVLRMFCQYPKAENMHKIKSEKSREFLKNITEKIADSLSVQFVKGIREQEFAVKMYFKE